MSTFSRLTGAANPFDGFDVGDHSTPSLGDIDGDGDLDLVVGQANGSLSYYRNTGTATTPAYAEQTGSTNPLNGFGVGLYSTPSLGDIDGDGDLDLVAGRAHFALRYYRNTGTATAPAYAEQTGAANPFNGFSVGTLSTPSLGDIDGDGDLDLIGFAGTPRYYRNIGTATAPVYAEQTGPVDNPFYFISGGLFPTTSLGDIDGDGDLDLIVGESDSSLRYFRNTGTATAPAYVEQTGVANPFNGFVMGNYSAPSLADIDGDGDLDLVVGNNSGTVFTFINNDAPATTPVTLTAIQEDSSTLTITQAMLLANAKDVDAGASLTASKLSLTGGGTLKDNGNGTWGFTPALNDDTGVSFSYTVSDGTATTAGTATLDLTPVNDAPTTTPVTLTAIQEDSTALTITQAMLLVNAKDVDLPAQTLTASGLSLTGKGTLTDNKNGTWSFTPALNDDTNVSFSYTISDGNATAAGTATLDITPVNDAITTTFSPLTGAANPFDGFDVGDRSTPSLGDIDGDGDLDLVVGEYNGTLRYYRNTGTATAPAYAGQTGAANPFHGIGVGTDSAPSLGDIDGDGDLDLVVGEREGSLRYFRNTGTATAPAYAEQTGAANPFNGFNVGLFGKPSLGDIDGDGDIDLVVGENGGTLRYYRNSGTATAPSYAEQTGAANPYNGFNLRFNSTPSLGDIDGDGDLDLVVGNLNGPLSYYRNTGTATAPAYAEQTAAANPFNDLGVGTLSAPSLGDIDGDGDLDLVAGEYNGTLLTFQNQDTPTTPVYVAVTGPANPFNGFDVGDYSKPSLGDIDGDGDLDLVVGRDNGTLRYFRNTGTATAPAYAEQTAAANPFNGFDVESYSTPSLGDIDGDGDLDLVVGNLNGNLIYYRNTGTATAPAYAEQTGTANPFYGLGVGTFSAPSLGDIDGDGDLDLVVGNGSGTLRYYRNTGTATAPAYAQQAGAANPFNGFSVGLFSTPSLGDIDGDGDLDLVVGVDNGTLRYYRNTGTSTAPAYAEQADAANPFNGLDVGSYSAPSLADIDGDGDLDLVVGDKSGTVFTFINNDAPATTPVTLTAIQEDSSTLTITQAMLLANAKDVDAGASLTASKLSLTGGGTLKDNGNGTWGFTPALNDDTSVSFSYTVSDGTATAAGSATLDITPVNDAPTVSIGSIVLPDINEDTPLTGLTVDSLLGLGDVDSGALRGLAVVSSAGRGEWQYSIGGTTWTPIGATTHASAVLLAAGTLLRYVPDGKNGETANLVFRAWDQTSGSASTNSSRSTGDTTTNGGATAFSVNTTIIGVDVSPVNDAPTTAPVTLTAIQEDSSTLTITQAMLLANAKDVDLPAQTLTASSLSLTGKGTLTDNKNGTWSFTPALNDDTSVSFSYTVSDGTATAAGTATLDLTPVNDRPVAVNDTFTTNEDTALSGNVLAANPTTADSDPDGGVLTVIEVNGSSANVGVAIPDPFGRTTFVLRADGTLTFDPTGAYDAFTATGSASFFVQYTLSDGQGGTSSASVFIAIGGVNDVPTTTPVALAPINEDSGALLITQEMLLQNANDLDFRAVLTATGLTKTGGNGTLTNNNNGTWSYTPALNDDSSVSFSYTVSDGTATAAGSATLDITPVNDAPTTTAVTLTAIQEDSTALTITQAMLLANASDVDLPAQTLTASGLSLTGSGTLVDNKDGTWSFTPALNDDTSVSFSYTVSDGTATAAGSATLDITPVNDTPTTTPVTLTAIEEDSSALTITQAMLLANAKDVDLPAQTLTASKLSLTGNGTLTDNGNGTWSFTPALNDDTSVSFSYTVSDGTANTAGSATLDITPVNDAPTTTPVTLTPIQEDSSTLTITQAMLLVNAKDVDLPTQTLTASGLSLTGNGTLTDNGNGTWSFTPALNDDTSVSFSYTVSDGTATAAGSATLDITPVNDAPTTTPVTLTAIQEDSSTLTITQAMLLANAADVDLPAQTLTASKLSLTGSGTLKDNNNGTWSFTPALNDDSSVSFSYTVSDGTATVAGSATLDITPVNDAPTTTPVTLSPIQEDSSTLTITQAMLLVNAKDVDLPTQTLTASGLSLTGNGTLTDNGNGTWSFTPALNDDTSVSFSYTVSDGTATVAGSATLDITPVNDAPTTTAVTLSPIQEDSSTLTITQAMLLGNAADVDLPAQTLTASGLSLTGKGTLTDNGNGTWSYTPALNDDTDVSFSYTISDGNATAAGSATLDITPVNDAPTTTPVTLTAIQEDSTALTITQAMLLANAKDVDLPAQTLTASGLSLTGGGTLKDNNNGTWSFTPALNDDTSVSFSYTISDGTATAAGSATLDITPVNDAPTTTPVKLAAIQEDSTALTITQAMLLANAADVDLRAQTLTASSLSLTGGGTLKDNNNGTWSYTPALNDDTDVSFGYTVSDGTATTAGTATLDITPVNDAPTTTPVTLSAIQEDSSALTITQAMLLGNAKDVDLPAQTLTASGLSLTGSGTLKDNNNGTWSFTPALNDDTSVSFSYTISDGTATAAGSATLDITPVNDAPTTTPVTLTAIQEDSTALTITQAMLLANASDVDLPAQTLTASKPSLTGSGTLTDNNNGTWSFTPALNDDTSVSFSYTVSDGSATVMGSATLDLTPINDAPTAIQLSASEVDEFAARATVIGMLTATDIDGGAPTFTLLPGQDAGGRFELLGNELRVADGLLLDFELGESHTVGVRVEDGAGGSFEQTLTITLRDLDPEVITGDERANNLFGGNGKDQLSGGDGADVLVTGAGEDSAWGGEGNDYLYMGEGKDVAVGGAGQDVLLLGGGDDSGYGGEGQDYLYGGAGNDALLGEAGDDVLLGEEGDDALYGGPGNDWLYGGPGNDSAYGGEGDDIIMMGEGNDSALGDAGRDYLYMGAGNDVALGGAGQDVLLLDSGDDYGHGGADQDHLYGGAGNDVLLGEGGDDVLLGEGGNDWLYGGAGNDWIDGGAGAGTVDYAWGEAGNDAFVIRASSGVLVVQDFTAGGAEDQVLLAADTGITSFTQALAASTYVAGINTTIVTVDADTAVWLVGVNSAQLTAADFAFV